MDVEGVPGRSIQRRAGLPLALAAALVIAGTGACGGGPANDGGKATLVARVEAPPELYTPGEPFSVRLFLINSGPVGVSRLQLGLSADPDGAAIVPTVDLPAALGPGGSTELSWRVSAGNVGPMKLSFRAGGTDDARSAPLEATAVISLMPSLTIDASAGRGGSISPVGVVAAAYGGSQSFSIAPEAHHHVAQVLVDGVPVDPSSSFDFKNITASHTIAATFAVDVATITATAGENGRVEPAGALAVDYGGSQALSITPAAHYHVADVLVDGASVGPRATYAFTDIGGDHTLRALFAVDTWTVSSSAGQSGTVVPAGPVAVDHGGSQTFAITPAAHCHVTDVQVDGVSVGPVSSYAFSNVGANHTLSATFAIDTVTVTASAGANGGVSPAGAVKVDYGTSPAFTVTPNAHYHVSDVLVDGTSVGPVTSYTFNAIGANHTLAASFAIDNWTITARAGANGGVSPSGAVGVNYGASQTFAVTPATHYHVADVLVDGVSVGPVTSYTFSGVSTDHTLSASFAIDTRTVTASAGAHGTISPSGAVAVPYGGSQTFTISPASGYHVSDVLVDGSSVGPVTSYSFTGVSSSHTISATFVLGWNIVTSATGSGSVSPSGTVTVNAGASQAFTFSPAAHYHVADVYVDDVSVGARSSYTFNNVGTSHSLDVFFEIDTRTITASAGAGGSISPSGAVTVPYGASQRFTISPASGYHVSDVLVDGSSVGPVTSYSFTGVSSNHTISATFSTKWTIVASATGSGSVSPSGATTVSAGASQSFSFSPASHYHVADVYVDDVSIGARSSYTFSNVTTSHSLDVFFEIDTVTVTASSGGHGTISPSGAVAVPYGGSQTFTLTPNSGYHVGGLVVDGSSVGAVQRYTLSNVTSSHSLSATFASGAPPRAVFIGSSTTEGAGASDTAHRWTSLVAACFGWTEVNQGIGGSTMTMLDGSGTSGEARWSSAVVGQDPDVVFIQYGANDIMLSVPQGTPSQAGTFRHATAVTLGGIAAGLPSIPIFVVEPQPATSLSANRGPYDTSLAEAAAVLGLPVVHAGQAFPAGQHAADATHLDDAGHAALAQYVATTIAALNGWSMAGCSF